MIGIYKITSPSTRIYIGQSLNLESRVKNYEKLNCKIVLNTQTGIFYNNISEASRTLSFGCGKSTLAEKLQGKRKNNTNFIYV